MKTEWRFHFELNDFVFEKTYKYKGNINKNNEDECLAGIPDNLSFELRIEPEKENKRTDVAQVGSLYITLPLPHDKAEPIIMDLAHIFQQRISLEHGEFKLLYGMISCKRIPETPEEEKEIGDKPFYVKMHLEEYVGPPIFDSKKFSEQSSLPLDMTLISQHNTAKRANNPIDKFLGFFKILESSFPPKFKNQRLKECLESNTELYEIFTKTFKFESTDKSKESFKKFIKSIVHARHRCAHLKAEKSFGYVPTDPKVRKEVEPYLDAIEILTYETIIEKAKKV